MGVLLSRETAAKEAPIVDKNEQMECTKKPAKKRQPDREQPKSCQDQQRQQLKQN